MFNDNWQKDIKKANQNRILGIRQGFDEIEKAKELPIGTITTHGGKRMKKVGKGKWIPAPEKGGGKQESSDKDGKSEQAKSIINGGGSKADRARKLHDIGMKTAAIAKALDMHYSHAHSTIKKHKDNSKSTKETQQKPTSEKQEEPKKTSPSKSLSNQSIAKWPFEGTVGGSSDRSIQQLLGTKTVNKKKIANALFSGLEGSVDISVLDNGNVRVSLLHDLGLYEAERILRRNVNTGELSCVNENLSVSEDLQGSGVGTSILKNQVIGLREMNVSYMTTSAFGEYSGFHNGYYTWGRLGYIPDSYEEIKDDLIEYTPNPQDRALVEKTSSLIELLSSTRGRNIMKLYGQSWEGSFDLSDNSDSMIILEEYLKAKGKL